ncbi:MAG: MgtC/SapB family protein [Woeseia sp.]
MDEPLLHRLAVALGVGLIVGVERGWRSRLEAGGQRPAGVRTFSLVGLLGGVLASLGDNDTSAVLAAGILAVGGFGIVTYVLTARETRDLGMTTELALIVTFGLGALSVLGAPFEATAAAIVMALVLGLKSEFHEAILGLERHELLATLQLLLIAVVLVPLLPSRPMGPWDAVNPRTVGMLVLLIAGFSYIGYFAVRAFGSRLGLMLTALFGGLSSSTAVTVAYARRSLSADSHRALFGAGIALAAAMMVPRLSIEIAVVNPALLQGLWPTFVTLALVPLAGVAWVTYRNAHVDMPHDVQLSNPLQLRTAVVFGLLLSVLFIAGHLIQQSLGDAGMYAMAAVAGLVDVDAISLSLAQAASKDFEASTAERAIVIAMLVNTASKAVLAATLGGMPMLRSATAVLAVALVAGATVAFLTLG